MRVTFSRAATSNTVMMAFIKKRGGKALLPSFNSHPAGNVGPFAATTQFWQ